MSIDVVSPLRQRMIEDMTARKLSAGTQKAPHQQLQAVRCVSPSVHRHGQRRGHSPVPAAPRRDRDEHLQPQSHHDRAAVLVPRDAAAVGPCGRDLSPPRTAEDPSGDEPGRDAAATGGCHEPARTRVLLSLCLRLRIACRRSGPAQGQAHRQRAEDHSRRAGQRPQGSQRHALTRAARSVAAMVERAAIASRCGNAAAGTLAVPRQQGRASR